MHRRDHVKEPANAFTEGPAIGNRAIEKDQECDTAATRMSQSPSGLRVGDQINVVTGGNTAECVVISREDVLAVIDILESIPIEQEDLDDKLERAIKMLEGLLNKGNFSN